MDPASPEAIDALFSQARRAVAAGRIVGGVAVARAAVRAAHHGIPLQIASLLSSAGETSEARVLLQQLVTEGDADAILVLSDIAIREGRLEEAVLLVQSVLAARPLYRHLHYTLTSLLPHLGRFDEANRHAARGTLLPCGDLQLTSSVIIRFPETLPTKPSEPPFSRRVEHEPAEAAAEAEAIFAVGCDSRYFLLFGEALAVSLSRRGGARFALHIHLINPDQSAEALLHRLRMKAVLPIICSRETVDLSALTERQRRTYLSCARYLVLPDLLERYAKPMIVTDIDQLVVADLQGFLRDLAMHDVAILRDDSQLANILALISASVFAINCSPGGQRFARTLCDTVADRMRHPAGLSWHLDQASLAVAHLWHTELRTLRLPTWIMDSMTDPNAPPDRLSARALFWSITMTLDHTTRKLQTSLFQQFLEADDAVDASLADVSRHDC